MITVNDQVKFFDWQLNELALSWESYMNSRMTVLFTRLRAFAGELSAVDRTRGNVIFKFSKGKAPRLGTPYSLYLYKTENGTERLGSWDIKFKEFRTSSFCHYRENSEPVPVYHLDKDDDGFHYLGCANIDIEVFDKFELDLSAGKRTKIILGEKEPPYQFLLNLKAYVSAIGQDIQLSDYSNENYEQVPFNGGKIDLIQSELNLKNLVIIQGPPGTGKSTLTADLVAREVKKGKSVCITALSNKALTEIAGKAGIADQSTNFRVYKTSLTKNELQAHPFLQDAGEIMAVPKAVLLTTYYKLSAAAANGHKLFDILVIEEASQAFLPVLFSFTNLAEKTLIIGDPMQLPPIVLNESSMTTIHPEMVRYVNGLDTLMRNSANKAFLLTESFRLSPFNANMTGFFYDGLLTGHQNAPSELVLNERFQKYFNVAAPHQLALADDLSDRNDLEIIASFLKDLLTEIKTRNPTFSIALLTPFKRDVLYFQQEIVLSLGNNNNGLIIETIDKVQGLTVDITILVLNIDGNPSFVFNRNRFNVATSRARLYNLTITDRKVYCLKDSISQDVDRFIRELPMVRI
ncbi:AAA family ATPase [Mucilaginibacter roseus]|uniref:AAA family ATPase n=1 Tax=Mucilaginibacter roseus TaxID=1528868 RepID=A0ABS8U0X7_9SPHI|nr:AAA domain-containing protein [Mucilaginibacter roseus]MCD8740770.1 AAA family ATPase [Mucilaginibacter roseus]